MAVAPARSAPNSGARRDRSAHQGRSSGPKDKGGIGEAKAELERFVAELAVGTPTERTTVTVSEMLQAYLAHCKRVGRTQSTIESYEYSTTRVPAALGSLPLTELTSHHLDTLYGDLAERLGDNTIRQTHAILTAALEQALKWGWMRTTPPRVRPLQGAIDRSAKPWP